MEVCNNRLSQLPESFSAPQSITDLFPGISDDEEATYWGVDSLVSKTKEQLVEAFPRDASLIEHIEPLRLFFLGFWAEAAKVPLEDVFIDFRGSAEVVADALR